MRQLENSEQQTVLAGAAVADLTPDGSVFLFGYPHVPRHSTGVHDPLEGAVLYVKAGSQGAVFIACDLIYFSRDHAREIRERAASAAGLPVEAVMLTATHTHSGPVMTDNLSNSADSVVPRADRAYLATVTERIVAAVQRAVSSAEPSTIGLSTTRAEGVGSNRHDPSGPADPQVPVMVVRSRASGHPFVCMIVYAMHPTVLHEDSKLISADFPGFTRRILRDGPLPKSCVILYHQGASGNQSPRHLTKANTFAEAERIGANLARCIEPAIARAVPAEVSRIECRSGTIPVMPREFPDVTGAERALGAARDRFQELRAKGAPREEVRTAECDVFGAEKTLTLARAAADGRLAAAVRAASPAEIQMIRIGPWRFVGWPGEFFVEHSLALRAAAPEGTFLITIANGELQGYIATPEAVARKAYEATNAVFRVENGARFVARTLELIRSDM